MRGGIGVRDGNELPTDVDGRPQKRNPRRAQGAYPKRPVTQSDAAAKELKYRTLAALYNARPQWPQWLTDAHAALDAAVANAYRWHVEISNADALQELLARNVSASESVG